MRGAAAAALVFAAVAVPGSVAASGTEQSCGWIARIAGDQLNVAFPDQAVNYWAADVPIPPGYHVEIDGIFPHARYISFVTYDPATRAIDGLPDVAIAPNRGSTNPFRFMSLRTATKRSYTVYVRNEARPASRRAPNTIYLSDGAPPPQTKTSQPTELASMLYRVYEADRGRDITGGAGLPTLSLVADDGSRREALPACPDHSLPSTQSLTDALAGSGSGAGNDNAPPVKLGGQDPPVWRRYTNAVNGVGAGALDNPTTGGAWPAVQQTSNTLPGGGFYDNPDNAYMTAFDSAAYGDVLVFHGKAPTTPQTYSGGRRRMPGGQLRYWSVCSNTSTTQYLGCVHDDQVTLDSRHDYTIVISTAANRPASANPRCSIEWLPKGPLPSAPLILRNLLPDKSFAQAIQRVPAQGQEQRTLGPYYPLGYYFDHAADFDKFVAANGGCRRFKWPYGHPPKSH